MSDHIEINEALQRIADASIAKYQGCDSEKSKYALAKGDMISALSDAKLQAFAQPRPFGDFLPIDRSAWKRMATDNNHPIAWSEFYHVFKYYDAHSVEISRAEQREIYLSKEEVRGYIASMVMEKTYSRDHKDTVLNLLVKWDREGAISPEMGKDNCFRGAEQSLGYTISPSTRNRIWAEFRDIVQNPEYSKPGRPARKK